MSDATPAQTKLLRAVEDEMESQGFLDDDHFALILLVSKSGAGVQLDVISTEETPEVREILQLTLDSLS